MEMREKGTCKNCGITRVRVTACGSDPEMFGDLMSNCPNCHSNLYKSEVKVDELQKEAEKDYTPD